MHHPLWSTHLPGNAVLIGRSFPSARMTLPFVAAQMTVLYLQAKWYRLSQAHLRRVADVEAVEISIDLGIVADERLLQGHRLELGVAIYDRVANDRITDHTPGPDRYIRSDHRVLDRSAIMNMDR